jgi:competence protein ComEC
LQFKLQRFHGILITILFISLGALATYYNHPANKDNWLPTQYNAQGSIKAVLQEPLSSKPNSFKVIASTGQWYTKDSIVNVKSNIIIYFSREVNAADLSYGSTIIINKPLIPVKTSGNPGAFDYQRYCTFAKIAYQVFLKPGEFEVLHPKETRGIKKLIFKCRQTVLNILSTYIIGAQERALAEALLIGYKDDLDKNLVQAYSNTGVIHIIAVSGLHLGIVYWLLSLLVKPLTKRSSTKWIGFALILAGLWMFSLLAGAGPSVIRSALMFSFIVIGNAFSKTNSVYNNLAASAFLLLCWNPFWLWDVGFQLSYAAVLSIVIFFRPIYNLLYVQNKLLDAVWKLNSVTLSAQLLTIPFCLYHFHQFPNLFLLANMVAVPLSSLLLIGEIILCAVSVIPLLASWLGAALSFLTRFLNSFIQHINELPFTSWTHLQLSFPQGVMLLACIVAVAYWLMQRSKPAFLTALSSLALFMMLRTHSFIVAAKQHKLIVYNVPRKPAIDFVQGRHYYFAGDASVQSDPSLRNFHLEPSRILHRMSQADSLPGLLGKGPLFLSGGKKILIAHSTLPESLPSSLKIDLLIVSKGLRIPIQQLLQFIHPKQVIADATTPFWKVKQWQQYCHALNIPFYSVSDSGAFILSL